LLLQKLDPFFDYYQRELTYLRHSGGQFAQDYPKIAKRLDLSGAESSDPHVERLLESFAYLTARLQRDIDDQYPRFTEALLGVLYPQFVDPIPSFAIAHFEISADQGKITTPLNVPRHAKVFSRAATGESCHFRTGYDLDLTPVDIESATLLDTIVLGEALQNQLKSSKALRLRLVSKTGTFREMGLERLRVHIAGNPLIKNALYEGIFAQEVQIALQAATPTPGPVIGNFPAGTLRPVGFGPGEDVLPFPTQTHPGYRLLLEYFHYPEKFFFFDIKHKNLALDAKEMDIYFSFCEEVPISDRDVSHANFLLRCAPIINLFHKITEPIRLDHRSVDYRLIPDVKLEKTTEIHSILEVSAAIDREKEVEKFMPYFSYNHQLSEKGHKAFWHARRTPAQRTGVTGTDMYLSFVDFDFSPLKPVTHTVYAKSLCTNRDLASQIPPGGELYPEEKIPASRVFVLDRPTRQVYPPSDGQTQWRLISQMSLNHLCLSGGEDALRALKEVIRLYANIERERTIPELDAITGLKTQLVTRRFGTDAWRGFAQGTKISLTFGQDNYHDLGAFVFSTVLNHFFSLFASVNSFTELEVFNERYKGTWKTWQPTSGNKALL
jgi:type VI secretion system protein ImpG